MAKTANSSGSSARALMRANPYLNIGRQRNFITGIQGVTPGGQAQINFACDRRYHRLIFQCSAVYINYTGGAALTFVNLTHPTATPVTGTLAVSSGVPGAVSAVSATGAIGWVTNDVAQVLDATGAGATFTVTASGGVPSAFVYASGTNVPQAIQPAIMLGTVKMLVNGVNVCDLTAQQEIQRALFNFMPIGRGQLPILFTEPWRNLTRWPEITSWDMAGQSSFQLQIAINGTFNGVAISVPALSGYMEFDYIRNTAGGPILAKIYQQLLSNGNAPAPVLMPISRHAFSFQANAGLNLYGQGQIPFNYPILRMYILGSSPGNITQLEIDQDATKVEEAYIIPSTTPGQLPQEPEALSEYGFNISIFDAVYVADITQRVSGALKCQTNLQLKIYSAVQQNLTIIQEKLPKSYAS